MIQLVRIDDRLLHGQVAYSWKAELGYEAIVIVSNSAAEDNIRKAAIKMAKPDGVKLAIRNEEEAVSLLKNSKLEALNVFVVVDTIQTADYVLRALDQKVKLNIGGIQKADNKEPLASFAYVTNEDKQMLRDLEADGFDIEFKLVPSDKPKKLTELDK